MDGLVRMGWCWSRWLRLCGGGDVLLGEVLIRVETRERSRASFDIWLDADWLAHTMSIVSGNFVSIHIVWQFDGLKPCRITTS